jgi:hypothetical protein
MYFETDERPKHYGTETYRVSFLFKEQDDLYDVKGMYVQFTIRPEQVVLRWERERGQFGYGPWVRARSNSLINGSRVLKDGSLGVQTSIVEVFASKELGGKLTQYAASLPHLEQMIEELEKKLVSGELVGESRG